MGEGDECVDKEGKFFLKQKRNGQPVLKKCAWLGKKNESKRNNICSKTERHGEFGPAQEVCPKTCATCDDNGGGDGDNGEEEDEGGENGEEEGEEGDGEEGEEEGDECVDKEGKFFLKQKR